LLFMVVHKHTAEMCPAGMVRPDKEFAIKLEEQFKKAGVNLIEGYFDGPGHEWFYVIEADDIAKIATAMMPLYIGENRIIPVMKYSDSLALARKIGFQK